VAGQEFNITGIAESKPTNSTAQMSFGTENGQITCNFQPDLLPSIINRLSGMLRYFQAQILAKGGHLTLVPQHVTRAAASSPVGADTVLLYIENGIQEIQHFALVPALSKELRRQMQEAEEALQRTAAQTRQ
jgi:hypothetical protein